MKGSAVFVLAGVLAASMLAADDAFAQQAAPPGDIPVFHVQQNVYMVVGPSGNSAIQIGSDGVVVVDTMTSAVAPKLVTAIRSVSSRNILQIINTDVHADRTGGNAVVAQATRYVVNDQNARAAGFGAGAPILAHEHVLQNMTSATGKYKTGSELWPTESYFENQRDLFLNGEGIEIHFQPGAHTNGDSMVYFRRSDVLVTGDIFTPQQYPMFDIEIGGSINGVIAGLNHILRITVPAKNEEGGTYVIPGRGHVCDEADVSDYRDMVTIVRDRVQDALKKRMTLEQVKAARLTRDYDGIYASAEYTGDMFVESVYKSLSASSTGEAKPATGDKAAPRSRR
jgi:glyoxylase-like metal-dependent hydrolase (beta-lactamase superfamily II)